MALVTATPSPLIVNPQLLESPSVYPSNGGYSQDGYRTAPAQNTLYNGRGAYIRATGILDIVPYPYSTTSVATVGVTGGTGNDYTAGAAVPLITTATNGNTPQTIQSQSAVLLDCPRALVLTFAAANTGNWTITGLDVYRRPMTETLPVAAATTLAFKKAFWCVFSITGSSNALHAGAVPGVTVGCQNVFGLPYALPFLNYVYAVNYNGDNALNFGGTATLVGGTLAVTDYRVTANTRVTATDATGANAVRAVATANTITFTGTGTDVINWTATNTIGNLITAADIGAPNATTGIPAATASSGDVRGTIAIGGAAAGAFPIANTASGLGAGTVPTGVQLTVMYYLQGADGQLNATLQTAANDNPSVYANASNLPLTMNVTGTSTKIGLTNLIGTPQFGTPPVVS